MIAKKLVFQPYPYLSFPSPVGIGSVGWFCQHKPACRRPVSPRRPRLGAIVKLSALAFGCTRRSAVRGGAAFKAALYRGQQIQR
jgi:hypothetical protein